MSESRDAPRRTDEGADEASFSGPLAGRRGGSPVFLAVFGLAFAGLLAVAIGGRGAGANAPPPIASSAAAAAPSEALATPIVEVVEPNPSADHAPIVTSAPGPIQLSVRRHPESIFVSGDVFVEGVSWVFVSIQDAGRRIAGWTSVSVPGGAGPANGDGPTFRFAVEVALPEESREGPLLVQANAYSSSGQQTSSTTVEVAP